MSLFTTFILILIIYKFAYKPASSLLMGLFKSLISGIAELKSEWQEKISKK